MAEARILIVEDEAIVARDIGWQLKELGYVVAGEARRGEEAVALCGELLPDLVLMDIHLAGPMDGIQGADIIRKNLGIPVVFLTAFADDLVIGRAKVAQPYGYVVKPFDQRELRTTIEMALHRRQSEIREREQEEELAAIIRTALDGFLVMDRNGRILEVNDAAGTMHGYSREEMLARSLADLAAEAESAALSPLLRRIEREGEGRFERRHRHRGRGVIHVEVSCKFRPGLGGRFIAFLRDVTTSRRAQEMMQVEQERLRQLFRSAPVGISISAHRKLLEVNDVFCAITGYAREELVGQQTRFLYPSEEEFERVGRLIASELMKVGHGSAETRWKRKDGTLVTVLMGGSKLRWTDDESALVATVLDMTDRKRIEAELKESSELLRKAQAVAGLGTYKLDILQGVWTSSPQLDQIFGIEADSERSVAGWVNLVAPDQRAEMLDYFRTHVLTEHRRFEKEYRIVRVCDQQERWVSGMGELEFDAAGHPIAMLGTIQDITERKSLESQFRQAQKMEVVGQLAGGVAHDFNNILTAMTLNLEMLQVADLPADAQGPVAEIESMARRAARLTQQLLMFARRQAMQVTTVEINAAMTSLLKMLQRLLGEHIALNFSSGFTTLWVEADSSMLDQAVMNLCINARDAMPAGGALTISTDLVTLAPPAVATLPEGRAGTFACIAVQDTGQGMAPEVVQHIFEPFFTTKEIGKGTGLGLASVYGIVHQHQGWVNVESVVGRGTTFRIFLPWSEKMALPLAQEPASQAADAVPRGNETILLVEDEAVVRKVSEVILRRLGYQVVTAEDGPDALRLWEKHSGAFDLLFADMVMPGGMTGLQLGETFRQRKPALKIVLMSGYSAEIIKGDALTTANVAFLPKPFEVRMLATTIRRCLDGLPASAATLP